MIKIIIICSPLKIYFNRWKNNIKFPKIKENEINITKKKMIIKRNIEIISSNKDKDNSEFLMKDEKPDIEKKNLKKMDIDLLTDNNKKDIMKNIDNIVDIEKTDKKEINNQIKFNKDKEKKYNNEENIIKNIDTISKLENIAYKNSVVKPYQNQKKTFIDNVNKRIKLKKIIIKINQKYRGINYYFNRWKNQIFDDNKERELNSIIASNLIIHHKVKISKKKYESQNEENQEIKQKKN